jgi:hypothetical protein
MRAEDYADQEGKTHVRVRAGTPCGAGAVPVTYCVRASEAKLWELLRGEIVFPRFGEDYRAFRFDPGDWEWEQLGGPE